MTAPKERIAAAVEAAEQELDAAYWAACDEARAAVDPADLTSATWAQEFLAEAYYIALRIEAEAEPWEEARARF